MALQFDKDATLEFLEARKDQLFTLVLVILLLAGGWFLYTQSSVTKEELIQQALETPDRTGGSGPGDGIVTPDDVVSALLEERPADMYQVKRNPFSSPEEQLRIRKEVESAYQRGEELFRTGQFEAAIQQFERVIQLDVTESRINYPILPSEYQRRAMRENLKSNFDRLMTSAQKDVQEGKRLIAAQQFQEAETVLKRANENLSEALEADPDGSAIGQEKFNQLKNLQQEAFQNLAQVQTTIIQSDLSKGIQQAQQLLAQNDLIALLRSMLSLMALRQQLTQIDPNAELVRMNDRNRLNSLISQIQQRLNDNYATLESQAENQFNQAVVEKDLIKSREAVMIMRQIFQANPNNQELQKKIDDMVVRRADMVIEAANEFITKQTAILNQQQYEQFDQKMKILLIDEITQLRNLGRPITSTQRDNLLNLERSVRALRIPPPVTEDYDIISVNPRIGDIYEIELYDKKSRTGTRKISISLRVGKEDRRTGILLKQVDTANGFVILSKSGYSDAKVNIAKANQ